MALGRRQFLGSTAKGLLAAATGAILGPACRAEDKAGKKIVVGGHPWVYAATQPDYDIYPILDRIFADMSYAGLDGIEILHPANGPSVRAAMGRIVREAGLLRSGGSDWHGPGAGGGEPGSQRVPAAWMDEIERRVATVR